MHGGGTIVLGGIANRMMLGLALMGAATAAKYYTRSSHPKDRVVQVRVDDQQITAAKAKARAGLPQFFARLDKHSFDESSFGLKFDLNYGHAERGQAEIIWARDIVRQNGKLFGTLDNVPATNGFSAGEQVEIPQVAIADWAIKKNDKFEGHYTTRVLVSHLPPDQAQQVLARLAPI